MQAAGQFASLRGLQRSLRGAPPRVSQVDFWTPLRCIFHKLARNAGRRPVCEPQGPPKVTPELPKSRPGAPQEVPKGCPRCSWSPWNPAKSDKIHKNLSIILKSMRNQWKSVKIHEYPMKNQRKSVKIHTHRLIVAIPIDVIPPVDWISTATDRKSIDR